MNGYEKIIDLIRKECSKNKPSFITGEMLAADRCKLKKGTILDAEDMIIPDYLRTGYMVDSNTKIKGLQKGDLVLLEKIDDEEDTYVMIGRVS